ncbi:MAG: DEAD/DEAH box helicase, partial [Simkania negevensis]|nr:DEAD/DEAH box helicase [Simkania negevensis]
SPFFLPFEEKKIEKAELAVVFAFPKTEEKKEIDVQLALRLPTRSKPLHIPDIELFLEAIRYQEPQFLGGKKHLFSLDSFSEGERKIARFIIDHAVIPPKKGNERGNKTASIDRKVFGMILAEAQEVASEELSKKGWNSQEDALPILPSLYEENLESSISFSKMPAQFKMDLEYLHTPASKILVNPVLLIDQKSLALEEAHFFECAKPGIIYNHVYYRFSPDITRQHLRCLLSIRDMTIPEPLFGTFVENALPELSRFASIDAQGVTEKFTTLPYAGSMEAICDLSFLNGELEATLCFRYDKYMIPAASKQLKFEDINSFVTPEGIVARNLVEEQKVIEDLFRDFIFDQRSQTFVAKSEKKIIEFMTDVIPRNQEKVKFNCPQNLLDQFIYDQTKFTVNLTHTDRMDIYNIELQVNGSLKGVTIDQVWDCFISRRAYLELDSPRSREGKQKEKKGKFSKILVLNLDEIGAVIQLFDELGIEKLDNYKVERPLWSLANIDETNFQGLPVVFTMSKRLDEIRKQMLGEKSLEFSPIPKQIKATLRNYQIEGVYWLERLRTMYLNGILADDMGLGKTLQAIITFTQHLEKAKRGPVLVVCPTSLLYNWQEECHKFNPNLQVLVIDGMPGQRKKLISKSKEYDVIITSYSLLQKDVEIYGSTLFSYMILDEAQHIKNRGTRNAKSVKLIKAEHRLILSGTPIENSLDELWSLFDFLMPGFLGTYERFMEKYIKVAGEEQVKNLTYLRKKVAPFILRRMKADVLKDLPPVTENLYHCQLTDMQRELYRSYAASARDELVKLVERDGFDKVQIHVLATLTRLKQICCHPAIFAKEKAEMGDSAKYDMLIELLQTLIEGSHKTVIFSQYTRMLQIMREDFEHRGIRFSYLDGSSKNRLETVKHFNEDEAISVFLVSLKAGGTGLNLIGADTVIHYDMWWNPAVENQATDRVYRIGQKQSVSVYKYDERLSHIDFIV